MRTRRLVVSAVVSALLLALALPVAAQNRITKGVALIGELRLDNGLARTYLLQEDAVAYPIAIASLRQVTGVPLAATETAGNFNVNVGSHVELAFGEVSSDETEISVTRVQFALPAEYVAGQTVTVRLPVALIAATTGANNGSTIDLSVYKSDGAGAVGSDLCATAAQTFAAVDTWYNKDFTVTPTGLEPGDVLNLEITGSVIENDGGAGTLTLHMDTPQVLLDIKG